MCKVYNPIGCLTTIKSHLHEHNLDEYRSLNELINFQNNYSVARQKIISNHKLLISQEKNILSDEITQLDQSIKAKKIDVEQELVLELEKLKYRLNNLLSNQSNSIQAFVDYVKGIYFKLKIQNKKQTFNFKIEQSLKYLNDCYDEKNNRYQYIISSFDDAVNKSALPQIQELEMEKRVIDQINSSIYGAFGEQKVVKELQNLSDEYILINDFNCRFDPPFYNRQENEYIRFIQIDHILLGPSGIFLIETKNWSQNSLDNRSLYSPVQQIKRANFALYKILNKEISNTKLPLKKHHWGDRKIPVKNLIVLINHKPTEEFQYVKVLTLNELLNYVNYFKPIFSANETGIIANYLLHLIGK